MESPEPELWKAFQYMYRFNLAANSEGQISRLRCVGLGREGTVPMVEQVAGHSKHLTAERKGPPPGILLLRLEF